MKKILLLIALLGAAGAQAQSPWIPEKGIGYTHLAYGILPAYNQVFNGSFTQLADLNGTISQSSVQAYSELGITPRFGITAAVPLQFLRTADVLPDASGRVAGSLAGLGNVEIAAKYNFYNKGLHASGLVNFILPTHAQDAATGLKTGYSQLCVVPMVSVGGGLNKTYAYGYAGMGLFTGGLSSDLRFGVEVGYKLLPPLWAIFAINVRKSLENGSYTTSATNQATYLYVNDQSFDSFAVKLLYETKSGYGINAATNLISFQAKNLPFQRPFSLGLFKKF